MNSPPDHNARAAEAFAQVRRLAESIDAAFRSNAEAGTRPMDSAPSDTDPELVQELRRVQILIDSTQQRADRAEERARAAEVELSQVRAELHLVRELAEVETPTASELTLEVEESGTQFADAHLALVESLGELDREPPTDVDVEALSVRARGAEESLQEMLRYMQVHLLAREQVLRDNERLNGANLRLRNTLQLAQRKLDDDKGIVEAASADKLELEELRATLEQKDGWLRELRSDLKTAQRALLTAKQREEHLRRNLSG